MRLLTGPAGSGKTAIVLNEFREALRAGNDGVRLLTPTATLAQHLQNQVAREGLVLHRNLIQTLKAFVEEGAGGARLAEEPVVYLLVEQAARRVGRPEFARVADAAGFCAALARTIEEFASAGCDSARLAECLPDTPLGAAFLEVYAELERQLEARGLELRARRLERVAARVEREGTGGIRTIWLDGFHALPDPELRVIGALGRHADVTLSLADGDLTAALRKRLEGMGFREERAPWRRAAAALAVVKAPGIEREAEEIARRILEQAAAGREFHEMGIIVRVAETYVPILRSTMERFGIPARFYFEQPLDRHAAVRYLSGAMDAMLGGWDHSETLKVLRLAPRFADWNAMDRFDFAVREQIPNAGLGGLKALAAEIAGGRAAAASNRGAGRDRRVEIVCTDAEGLGGAVADSAEPVPAGAAGAGREARGDVAQPGGSAGRIRRGARRGGLRAGKPARHAARRILAGGEGGVAAETAAAE